MKITCVVGRKRSGKDTFFKCYKNGNPGVKRGAFADELKNDLSKLLALDISYFHDDTLKETPTKLNFGTVDIHMTPRDACIKYGRFMADTFGDLYWVRRLFMKLEEDKENSNINELVITDARFLVEIEYLLETYKDVDIYYIDSDRRLGPMPENSDRSETEGVLIRQKYSSIIKVLDNNGPEENFKNSVKNIC